MVDNMSNGYEKVSISEAQKFYEDVYKSVSKDEINTKALKQNVQDEINSNPLFKKQFEYHLLIDDFFSVTNKRNISPEKVVSTLNTSPEVYNTIVFNYKAGEVKSAAVLNNAQVYKMAAFVLKDKILEQIETGTEYSSKENLLSDIFTKEKERIQDKFNEKHNIKIFDINTDLDNAQHHKKNTLKP